MMKGTLRKNGFSGKDLIMRIRQSTFDRTVYYIACVFTMGAVYLLRLIISEGLRQAFHEDVG